MNIPLDQTQASMMQQYHCDTKCTWCDGCGDYGIWTAVKRALVESGIPPTGVVLCYDVGCHGNTSDKLLGYRFHGLHGRVLPFAAGAKLGNPKMPVMAFGGDGASFSEGIGHLVHAVRSNYPIVFVLHNNANYGLTTGQASSLTWQGQKMNTSPNGMPEHTLNSMDFIFSLEPTFVGRAFSGNIPMMTNVLKAALKHNGFAFVDLLQACPTYNHFATHDFLLERCKEVDPIGYDPKDFAMARQTAIDTSEKIACGVLYQTEDVQSFYDRLEPRKGKKTAPIDEIAVTDVSGLMQKFI